MISTLQLKQLGFKKQEEKTWTWGTYSLGSEYKIYVPILNFMEEKQIVTSDIASNEGVFEIIKKVSTVKELEDVMNMASFVLSQK